MKKIPRYKDFLLEKESVLPEGGEEGLNMIPTGISEGEAQKNCEGIAFIQGVYQAAVELFDIENVAINYSHDYVSFTIPQEGFSEYLGSGPEIQSPRLDRYKLRNASNHETAGVIIDLLMDRKSWNHHISSKRVELN